ncbi:MAG: hypothetical protein GEU90_06335 [Gemmatimonas sp.]|nr:hypothetical protein [Gemmatimonas sp.]
MRMSRKRIVLLGMMSKYPVAGVVWQTLHYLVGFERLGYEVYYVEAGGHQPSPLLPESGDGGRSESAAAFLESLAERFGFGDRWAFHALHTDGRCYGLNHSQLLEIYRSAELLVNLHGATTPLPEHSEGGRLIYLETDPVAVQIDLFHSRPETIEYLAAHQAFFTFAENYGRPDCRLPVSDRFPFRPTRQPVVLDFWQSYGNGPGPVFTTVGNWRQMSRKVEFEGETYHWSKHYEFLKFLDVPQRTQQSFELALSRRNLGIRDSRRLAKHGWVVRDALDFSTDLDAYRDYIAGSRGEFTVAKDQNVRLRTGWFSDRSATYLATGRPVVTQDTGCGSRIPTGEGLFTFSTGDEIEEAICSINSDYERHSRAAFELAREYFGHDVVLGRLLSEVGL